MRGLMVAGVALMATTLAGQEQGAWVTRIGNDTVAVETYRRTPDGLRGEIVTRTPISLHRIYTVTYHARGATYELVTHNIGGAPNVPAEARAGGSGVPYLFPAVGPLEDLVRSVQQDTGTISAVQMTSGNAVVVAVRRVGKDSVRMYLGPIVGPFVGVLDSTGNLIRISGALTTEKYEWERVADLDLAALGPRFASRPIPVLSPREQTTANFGGAEITIDYGSPSVRGRAIFGALEPWGKVWRTGANAATTFKTSAPLSIGGRRIPAGTYTLWILPTPSAWTLIINRQTLAPCPGSCPAQRAPLWGTDYAPDSDLARIPLLVRRSPALIERFAIEATPAPGLTGAAMLLTFSWEHTSASVEIRESR